MANFGARLAYPSSSPHATATGERKVAPRAAALLRRAVRALRIAFEEAPFHLLWPPVAPPAAPGAGGR